MIHPALVVVAFVAAALIAAASTPIAAAFARRQGLVVHPRTDRWHRAATPILGGAAIAAAVFPVLVLALPLGREHLGLILGAGAAFALGLLDDFRHVAPTTKLVGQVLVSFVLVLAGIHVAIVTLAPLAFVLTVFWVVALMNAMNLMDNMDGLAAGVSAIAGIVLAVTAMSQSPAAALVAASAAGAALGFLVHNFHPARVFMGDAGSLLLGFLLAAAALMHTASGAANVGLAVLGPLAALALPIFDTALVTVSRHLAGVPIHHGGRDHASHRLAALGLSDRNAVLLLYGIAAAFAGVGLFGQALSSLLLPLFALALVGLVLFGVFLAEVDVYRAQTIGRAVQDLDRSQGRVLQAFGRYVRFGAEVGLDVALLTVAYYSAYVIRFEALPEALWIDLFTLSVPVVVGAQLVALLGLRVYRALWRYLSVADAMLIFRAVTLGTGGGVLAVLLLFRFEGYSRAVFVLDWLFAAGMLVGARVFVLWLRHWFALRPRVGERRVLIVGATDRGVFALRSFTRIGSGYRAIGFVDDDEGKRYRRVAGVPVLGSTENIEDVLSRHAVDLVVMALEPALSSAADRVQRACDMHGVEWREVTMPV